MRPTGFALLLVATAACTVEIDYVGTEYRCPDGVSCPTGFECIEDVCRPIAEDAAPGADAALLDAPLLDAAATDAVTTDAPSMDATVIDAIQTDSGLPSDDDLLLHWKLDETGGTTVHDETANDRDGMRHGADWAPGYYGGALLYGGSQNDYVDDDDAGLYLNGLTAFTVTVWVQASEVGTDRGVMVCNTPDGQDTFLTLRYDASADGGGDVYTNVIKAGIRVVGGTDTVLESSPDVQTTDWQFLALTWESGAPLTLFIDGSEDTPTHLGPTLEGALSEANLLLLGKGSQDTNSSWWGLIDDFRIYDRRLESTEIQALYSVPSSPTR